MEILGKNKDDSLFKNERTMEVENNIDLKTSRFTVSNKNDPEYFSIKNETDLLSGADELTFGDYEIASSTDFGKDELRGINYDGAKGLTFKDYECIPMQIVSNRNVLDGTETIEETSDQNEEREITEDLFKKCNDELTFGDFEFVPTNDSGKNVMTEMDCDGKEESFFGVKIIFPTHILNNRVDPLNVKTQKIEKLMPLNIEREIIKDVSSKIETEDPLSHAPSDLGELTFGDSEILPSKRKLNCLIPMKMNDEECYIERKRRIKRKAKRRWRENQKLSREMQRKDERVKIAESRRHLQEMVMEAQTQARPEVDAKKEKQMNFIAEPVENPLDQNAFQKFPKVANELTPGEYEIVPTKDSDKNDEVKELTYCDCEHSTNKHETRREKNLRLNRERRWKSRQSEEQLEVLRAKDAKAARTRRQEKMKLLQEMEINT